MWSRRRPLVVVLALAVLSLTLFAATNSQTRRAQGGATVAVGATKVTGGDEPSSAPISLSDPDGQELILEKLSVRTAVNGMLSLTELELVFRNPQSKRIEGRFNCTLPEDAAISRFAKEVNGQLMEGEVVERLRANQVYDQILHQMRDPALLEQDQGNRFSARIFPIDPNASVRLVLSYSRLLPLHDGERTYSLPLRGMSKVGEFSWRGIFSALPGEERVGSKNDSTEMSGADDASHSTADIVTMNRRDWAPDRDIEVRWKPRAATPAVRMLRAGDFFLASYRIDSVARSAAVDLPWLFYVDTSASAADDGEHRIRAIERTLSALPPSDRVEIVAFDQSIVPLLSGRAADVSSKIASSLRDRHFLGGTDLGAVLDDIRSRTANTPKRVVLVTDGVATLGATERNDLVSRARSLANGTILHALVIGPRQDSAMLKMLTRGRGRVVSVPLTESFERRAAEAASLLREPLGDHFEVNSSSSEWLYPNSFDDVRNGDELIVLGKIKAGASPAASVRGASTQLDASGSESLPAGTFEPLLQREAYRAYLDYLAGREADEPNDAVRQALATEQVRISVENRVLIPRTTMLVLETENDYVRFGLDRRALAAILTIDAGGITRVDRHTATPPPIVQRPPMPMPVERQKTGAVPPSTEDRRSMASDSAAAVAPAGATVTAETPLLDVARRNEGITAEEAANAPKVESSASLAQSPAPTALPAPPPPPSPVAAAEPEQRRTREQVAQGAPKPAWMTDEEGQSVDDLFKQLARDPRDRELYNQLSDRLFRAKDWDRLAKLALQWQPYDSDNPQVYEVLGEALLRLGKNDDAARAFGSLVEVAPAKVELLQRAGLLLYRAGATKLAEAPLRKALELRPDRVNAYRHLALFLWQSGRYEEAARVLESATTKTFPNWYGNSQRVIREELAYVYRAWRANDPSRTAEIEERAKSYGADLSRRDDFRVTLAWETDANDVDLHLVDPNGEECFYGHKVNASGLELYEDITQGFGPEVIRIKNAPKGKYHVGVNYFSAGPMGVSRGIAVIYRNAKSDTPSVEIVPFRLVTGGRDIRKIEEIMVK